MGPETGKRQSLSPGEEPRAAGQCRGAQHSLPRVASRAVLQSPLCKLGSSWVQRGRDKLQAAGAEPAVSIKGPNRCSNGSFLQQFVSLSVLL